MQIALYSRTDGLLEPRSEQAFEWVKGMQPGSLLCVETRKDTRSELQNRYLNGWIYKQIVDKLNESGQLIHGTPWTRDTLHAAFQQMFLVELEYINPVTKSTVQVFESTAKMTRKRFCKYIDEQVSPFVIQAWNIKLEDPQDGWWRDVLRELEK